MSGRTSRDRDERVQSDDVGDVPPSQDLLDAFQEHGWEGDLEGALSEAPFVAPPVDADRHGDGWRTLFQDYLRGLPGHLRDKYAIRQGD